MAYLCFITCVKDTDSFKNESTSFSLLIHLPLKMWDELSNGDLLRHLVVKVLTVEHHGLQDGQGPLQHRCVHGRLVHVAGDLQER